MATKTIPTQSIALPNPYLPYYHIIHIYQPPPSTYFLHLLPLTETVGLSLEASRNNSLRAVITT